MEVRGSTNYWPGFVDVLSSIVLVMVFVVLVMTMLMVKYITAAAKARAERIVAERMAEMERNRAMSLKEFAEQAKLLARQQSGGGTAGGPGQSLAARIVVAADEGQSGGAVVREAKNTIAIEFEGNVLKLDEGAMSRLSASLVPFAQTMRSGRVRIVANIPSPFLSEKQRQAFFRAMAVRNYLLDKGMHANRITVHVDEMTTDGARPTVYVTFVAG